METQVGDIIIVDNIKCIILTNISDNGISYSFVNEVTDDESDITQNYYLVKYENNQPIKITDENEINRLFPKVQEGLKGSMDEFGIDYKNYNPEV